MVYIFELIYLIQSVIRPIGTEYNLMNRFWCQQVANWSEGNQRRIQDFPEGEGGANLIFGENFYRKLYESEENLT